MKRMATESKREERAFWMFIMPWFIGFILFTGGPIIVSLMLSFSEYNVISSPEFIGFDNFRLLFQDRLFYKSLSVTIYYSLLSVPFTIVSSLVIALLLNQKVRGQSLLRTLYYAPSVISGVAVSFLWSWYA